MPTLLFGSFHSYADTTSGAALATRDLLELLAARGWKCGVLCGPLADAAPATPLGRRLHDAGTAFEVRHGTHAGLPFMLTNYVQERVPITIFRPAGTRTQASATPAEGELFLNLLDGILDRLRPDIVLTYGGNWIHDALAEKVSRRRIPLAFALHNYSYSDAQFFARYDAVFVPTKFTRDHYRRKLGLEAEVLPCPWNWKRVQPEDFDRKYLTFVNPVPAKGLYVFARIAHELHRRRSDIPMLVIESRGRAESALNAVDLDLSGVANLHFMPTTVNPREFFRETKVLLVPSVWEESLGRVAAEAMSNGIPVLASDRGALPETLAGTGLTFGIPAKYTPDTKDVPAAGEVAAWVDAIIRLWDDAEFYRRESVRSRSAADVWHPDRLYRRFDSFFSGVIVKRRAR